MGQVKPRQVDSRGRLTLSIDLAGSWVTVDRISEDEYRVKRAKVVEADTFQELQNSPLSDADRDAFARLLDQPPEPNQRLRDAAKRYRRKSRR